MYGSNGYKTRNEALHEYWRKKQDEQFERNAVLRQKLYGIIICLLTILFQFASGDFWWVLISAAVMWVGIYLIFTERRL